MVYPKTTIVKHFEELERWGEWKDLPLSRRWVDEITDDVLLRFGAKSAFTYSPAKTGELQLLRESLLLDPAKKLIVAFTSSSDELTFAYQLMEALGCAKKDVPQAFHDQIDWLQHLIGFTEQCADIQLVVRIHPREGIGERYKTNSYHLEQLRQNFDRPYRNTKIIWPNDKTSSYDLMEIADLGLTSWSTTGLEMARMGVPVVTAFQHLTLPNDICLRWGGATPQDYLAAIREQLSAVPSLEMIIQAYRIYFKYRLAENISVSDSIPSPDFSGLKVVETPPLESHTMERVIIGLEDINDINRAKFSAAPADLLAERQAVLDNVKRLLWNLVMGSEMTPGTEILISNECATNGTSPTLCSDAPNFISFHIGGETTRRYSPLAYRLFTILQREDSRISFMSAHLVG